MNQASRILLVDDEPVFREFYGRLLRQANYEVGTAANGVDGLRCVREQRPDLVLVDVMLPDMSGLEVCRQIKRDPNLRDVFVALHSGEVVNGEQREDGLDSGADDYIVRPTTPNELLARLRALLRLRHAAAALRASERHFRRLVEILPDGVGLVDRTGWLRAVNPQLLTMLRYAREVELLHRNIQELVFPEDRRRIRPDTRLVLRHQSRRQAEYTLRRKDGTALPVELSITLTTGREGGCEGFVIVVRDITERRRAEARRAAFARLGARLSEASTSREAAQIIVDVADQLLGWDCCQVRLLSAGQDAIVPVLAFDEINGQRVECPQADLDPAMTPMTRKVLAEGAQLLGAEHASSGFPALFPFGDKQRRSASLLFAPIRKGDARLGVLSIQSYRAHAYTREDLDLLQTLADYCGGALERIHITESLQESESRFRSLFESAPFGLALHDARGRFLSTNRAYQAMLGYTDDELRRLGVKGITHPEDIAEGQRLFRELTASQRQAYHRAKRYLRKDGSVVWAESTASVVLDAHGKLRYIVSMVEDVTGRKRAAEEISRLSQTIEQQGHERLARTVTQPAPGPASETATPPGAASD